jgi:hypothetical protein
MAGFGIQTLIVALVIGGIAIVVAWKRPFLVLAALVLLVPFRDLNIRWMNAATDLSPEWVNTLSRWWFILILALLAVIVLQWILVWIKDRRIPKLGWVDVAFVLVILVAVISTFVSPNFSAGFTSLRGYLQPLGVFILARAIRPTQKQLQLLLILLLVVGVVLAAFEFWQVTGWDAEDYRARGYLDQGGRLVTPTITVRGEPYIRPSSTVSGPNELGVDMMLLMLAAVFGSFQFKGALRNLSLILLSAFALGIVLTFSRSAILGTALALLLSGVLLVRSIYRVKGQESRKIPRGFVYAGIGIFALVVLILILTGAFQLMGDTIANLSDEYHFVDSMEALQYLIKHPAGVGMGMVEPKGALILIKSEALFHVEGSLFQIAMEMGVWGLALWLLFWSACLIQIWRSWPNLKEPSLKILTGTALTGWLGALVAFLFLPLMQSISLMVWLWFLLGLALQAERLDHA